MPQDSDLYIFDFEDSFIFNIVAEMAKVFPRYQLVSASEGAKVLKDLTKDGRKKILLLGPGPGHPNEWGHLKNSLKKLMQQESTYFLGICLGHQILWRVRGKEIVASKKIRHGDSVGLTLPDWPCFAKEWHGKKLFVGKYNSLALQIKSLNGRREKFACDSDGEVAMGLFPRGLTYQFHPESVGTSYPRPFFRAIKNISV